MVANTCVKARFQFLCPTQSPEDMNPVQSVRRRGKEIKKELILNEKRRVFDENIGNGFDAVVIGLGRVGGVCRRH
jgi:hypothetical protein